MRAIRMYALSVSKMEAWEQEKINLQGQIEQRTARREDVPQELRGMMMAAESLIRFFKDQADFWKEQVNYFFASLNKLSDLAKQGQ